MIPKKCYYVFLDRKSRNAQVKETPLDLFNPLIGIFDTMEEAERLKEYIKTLPCFIGIPEHKCLYRGDYLEYELNTPTAFLDFMRRYLK